jgi:hypothetical protein
VKPARAFASLSEADLDATCRHTCEAYWKASKAGFVPHALAQLRQAVLNEYRHRMGAPVRNEVLH